MGISSHTFEHTYIHELCLIILNLYYQLNYHNIIIIIVLESEKSLSCVWLFATPWTLAHQAPLSMEFSRQEYWSG